MASRVRYLLDGATAVLVAVLPLALAAPASAAVDCAALSAKYPGLKGREIVVGISPAPANYSATDPNDPANIIGIEPDLLAAAGECLGFTFSYSKLDFAGLIPALQSGRINIIAAGMYSSDERSKQVDFVEYMKAGEASLVQAGNPKKLASLADTCGATAAQVVGTVENAMFEKQSSECEAAGAKPIAALSFPSIDRAYSALAQARADIVLTDAGVASYLAAKTPDKVEVGFALATDFTFGFGVSKSDPELRDGLHAALAAQNDAGAVEELMTKWGFSKAQAHAPSIKTQ